MVEDLSFSWGVPVVGWLLVIGNWCMDTCVLGVPRSQDGLWIPPIFRL